MLQNGQTPLSIAQKLGYITVIESLKVVTETTTTITTSVEEKYRVVAPEAMQETFMSDSEEEGGEPINSIINCSVKISDCVQTPERLMHDYTISSTDFMHVHNSSLIAITNPNIVEG